MHTYEYELDQKREAIPQLLSQWLSPFVDLETANILELAYAHEFTAPIVAEHYSGAHVYAVDLIPSETQLLPPPTPESLPENLKIIKVKPGDKLPLGVKFDLIYSWSALEHISQDLFIPVMAHLQQLLSDSGYMFTYIDPLYFSPFGSHLEKYIPEPWAHLTMQQNLLCAQLRQACADDDEYRHLCFLFNSLNRITPNQLRYIFESLGMKKIRTIHGINENFNNLLIKPASENKALCQFPKLYDLENTFGRSSLTTQSLIYLYKNRVAKSWLPWKRSRGK